MTTSPLSMPDLSFNPIGARENRAKPSAGGNGSPFNELLLQAVEERNGLPNGKPLTHSSVNALVEAVMSALKQARDSMGNTLPPGYAGSGANDYDSGRSANALDMLSPRLQEHPTGLHHTRTRPPLPTEATKAIPAHLEGGSYDQIIKRAAERYDVDETLIRSVIQVESSFNPKAVSPVGAMGMMQLMPGTARELGVKDPFNAEENIMGGTLYLSRLLDRYDGNVRSALAAYNWGMGNLERQPASAMPTETRRYVSKIMGMVDNKPMV